MKVYTERIEEHLSNREMSKAILCINEFIKKYEEEHYAQEKIYFYNRIKERIVDYKDI